MTKKKLELAFVVALAAGLTIGLLACARATPTPATSPAATSKPVAATAQTPPQTGKAKPADTSVSFAGKTVTVIVPLGAGSATDTLARLYAKFLPRFLPGNPSLIVRDMPGGGSTIGANYFARSKPDGLTVMTCSATVPTSQLAGMRAVDYDILKMTSIVAVPDPQVVYMKAGIVNKVEDLPRAKGIVFGHTSGSATWLFLAAKELVGMPTEKIALGYSSSSEARRAFLAGEINMSQDSTLAYTEYTDSLVKKGEAMPLFQTGFLDDKGKVVKDPNLPPVPTIEDLHQLIYGKPPSGIVWDVSRALLTIRSFGMVLVLPTGASEAVRRVYWDAADKMVKDTEFRATIDRLVGSSANLMFGEASDRTLKSNFRIEPKVADWLKSTLPKYGLVIE